MLRLNDLFNTITGNGIDKRNEQGETKLYRAAREGNVGAVKKLLRAGADPDIADSHGLTPLHQAAYWGEGEIVRLLLKAGAAPNVDNGHGWTALHSAALSGGMKSRGAIIRDLKAAGAKDDINDKNGWSARDYMQLWEENAHAAEKLKLIAGHGGAAPVPDADNARPPNTPVPPQNGAKPCGPRSPRH
ncbi:MAG: ankyrin repeat domain-containing protein [Alphaproteobacteria bacterium]|nr:ankyrin repeat domain-containing protein [Alphaproteobacteria bacterium]